MVRKNNQVAWQTKKLGEVVSIEKNQHKAEKALPYVGMEDIESGSGLFLGSREPKKVKSTSFSFNSRHVLYGRLRPYLNKVLLPDFSGHCSTEIFPVNPNNELDRRFLFFWLTLESTMQMIDATSTGARMPRANMHDVLEFNLSYPPLPEQQRIVAILDKAFEGIATAKANAEKNLNNAREVFESYLQGVFANKGDGWEEKTLGEVCTLRSGTTLPPVLEKSAGELPYLKVADMNLSENIGLIRTSSRYVNRSDINGNGVIPVGSTIFPKRGGAILTNKKRLTSTEILMDLNLMAVTPSKKLLPSYLYHFFLNLDLREINNGSSIPQINNYSIEPLIIGFPPLLEQQRIVSKLECLSAETKKLEVIYQQKLTALEELKKSILNQAFAGELA